MDWSKREGMDEEERWFYDQGYQDGLKAAEKRGKWIIDQYGWAVCSNCNAIWGTLLGQVKYKYCPNCGAEMVKVYTTREKVNNLLKSE